MRTGGTTRRCCHGHSNVVEAHAVTSSLARQTGLRGYHYTTQIMQNATHNKVGCTRSISHAVHQDLYWLVCNLIINDYSNHNYLLSFCSFCLLLSTVGVGGCAFTWYCTLCAVLFLTKSRGEGEREATRYCVFDNCDTQMVLKGIKKYD